jgi:hypothetical protein
VDLVQAGGEIDALNAIVEDLTLGCGGPLQLLALGDVMETIQAMAASRAI